CMAVAMTEPEPPLRIRPDSPAPLEQIVMHCLQKDPNRRYQSVNELANDLAMFAPVQGHTASMRVSMSGAHPAVDGRVSGLPAQMTPVPTPYPGVDAYGRSAHPSASG